MKSPRVSEGIPITFPVICSRKWLTIRISSIRTTMRNRIPVCSTSWFFCFRAVLKQLYARAYLKDILALSITTATLRAPSTFTGNIAYGQREFSHDNYLTELLRHTIEYIKGKPFGKILLGNVKDEIKLINAATPRYNPLNRQRIIELNTKNVVQHAFFREYLTLQRLCVCILQHRRHRLGSGSRQAKGIIFDGAWLWEEYVASLIGEYFYHPMNKSGKGAQYLFDGSTGLIYPDFIGKNPGARIIADAKYKPSDNIGDRDYLQLLAYMFRFDSRQGFFIYPENGESKGTELHMNRGVTFEHSVMPRNDITVTKLGLQIPSDAESYESFTARIQENEKRFIGALNQQP